ncbi:MAG: PIG-L family deacetylase [Lachnospiraceae bacterium]|jgi:LmbE family N-acetylglucosaminyl deacetylase|nr:PIG-L family deacetylase [Lachnospiraceae bacterium]
MKLSNEKACIFIPDAIDTMTAIKRTTHLCIAAHQDDVEIMAYNAIAECYADETKWFTAVVVTDGAGSPRNGEYAAMTDEEMQLVRRQEQNDAAAIGKYAAMLQLHYGSHIAKSSNDGKQEAKKSFLGNILTTELAAIIRAAAPQILFTHNPADKHDTHVGVLMRVLEALRLLTPAERPQKIYAMEVWRGLDWLSDQAKLVFDTSPYPDIAEALLSIFASQCAGGKRYDLAVLGRRLANATFHTYNQVDAVSSSAYGLDITALIEDEDITHFIARHIDDLQSDIQNRIQRVI